MAAVVACTGGPVQEVLMSTSLADLHPGLYTALRVDVDPAMAS